MSPVRISDNVNEKTKTTVVEKATPEKVDIEHAEVTDDPRQWSRTRKGVILAVISAAAMIAGLGSNIYNPAIAEIQADLNAPSSKISLSLSLFIMIQGGFPLVWSAISEVYGRKKVYLVSLALGTLGCIVSAVAKSINVLIGMRCIQGAGSSAVMSIGAATLADIYDPHERGTMMGLYYSAPLLGPALGPIIGGALTQGFNWRATFWFLVIFTGLCFVMFIFFKDTFRKERSLTYQTVLRRLTLEREAQQGKVQSSRSSMSHETAVSPEAMTEKTNTATGLDKELQDGLPDNGSKTDIEGQIAPVIPPNDVQEIKLTLADVNPIRPIIMVLARFNNLVILFASGLLFAFGYCITYTCSRTLSDKYGYNALQIGLVLLAYGIGSILGSVLGGRWSDRVFNRLKAQNGGVSTPELRLQSTKYFFVFLPASVIAYGWICEKHVHVAAICVMLFLSGFFSICIYASTLAYIVDANVGRSSSAVATNSCFRGVSAFVAAEVAVPIQSAIGDGGLYSLWAGLMVVSEALILVVWWKGGEWRANAEAREARRQK
ncbi:MFS transporter superfamily protein [Abortiporus biennis]